MDLSSNSGAVLSSDRIYRYVLWRRWEQNKPYALFIGLNPSTADETEDDPTIRRCKRYASDWGYGAVYMVNLFAFRATQRKDMLIYNEPTGIDNDRWLQDIAQHAGVIVCAWGTDGKYLRRDDYVINLLLGYKLMCLGTNKNGTPGHCLYIKANKQLEPLTNELEVNFY